MLALLLPLSLFARDIEIMVEDEELGLPLEGAEVALRNGMRYICDEDGKVVITVVDDRPTVIQAAYPGYENRRMTIPALAAAENSTDGNDSGPLERITIALRLGGIMEGRELIIEAERPETIETKTGRSVAISEKDLSRTAEIGIVEDVMTSVKLLPGVGYTGMFSAMPSIRGGDPGDLMAVFDGFYLERPYHWLGSISIFDPKMVSSARLSHGVFSSRYGHTISGLLEISSKTPSAAETELEAAAGSSSASLNLSLPLRGRGGVLFMGKVTYWDTLVLAAQGISKLVENETLNMINSVSTSPFIRSAAVSANYRFTESLEWKTNGFFGSDGVGASFHNVYNNDEIKGSMDIDADYANYQGFLVSGITASPVPAVALKAAAGVGFIETNTDDVINNSVTVHYNQQFLDMFPSLTQPPYSLDTGKTYTAPNVDAGIELRNSIFNAQARFDLDWEIGKGFLAAFGVQELYSRWAQNETIALFLEIPLDELPPPLAAMLQSSGNFPVAGLEGAALIRPMGYAGDVRNHGFTTSSYGLVEYAGPGRRFASEAGLRIDHLFFLGKDFSVQTMPVFNPRLNIDFNILKNRGSLDTFDITAGTGLFSSTNTLVSFIEKNSGLGDFDMKLNRSWTSVTGLKFGFEQGFIFNIEGYYKYVFDRAYITADTSSSNTITPAFLFDGTGRVWGFDLQFQKMEGRYWGGWISYTFNWAKYYDPGGGGQGVNMGSTESTGERWYYPSFHRFHNFNLVLNIKPIEPFNITLRFGFASGQPRDKVDSKIYPYPAQIVDERYEPLRDENGNPVIVQKYRRDSWYDENERGAWSLPLDIKLSFFLSSRRGKARGEIYLAAENLLSLVYTPGGNTTFNEYTGREDSGGGSGTFDLPIPMVSFGVKWRY
jgi:hypothetical protein